MAANGNSNGVSLASELVNLRKNFLQVNSDSQCPKWHLCYCYICEIAVTGKRYACMICADFNTCNDCRHNHVSTGHPTIRVTSPSDTSWRLCYLWSQRHHMDGDWDLVYSAIHKQIVNKYISENETTTDSLRQFTRSDSCASVASNDVLQGAVQAIGEEFAKALAVLHHETSGAVVCDKCHQEISSGVMRMTCVHCSGRHLCMSCEDKGKHDRHPMIRVCKGDDLSWLPGWLLAHAPIEVECFTRQAQQSKNNNQANGNDGEGASAKKKKKIVLPKPFVHALDMGLKFACTVSSIAAIAVKYAS